MRRVAKRAHGSGDECPDPAGPAGISTRAGVSVDLAREAGKRESIGFARPVAGEIEGERGVDHDRYPSVE